MQSLSSCAQVYSFTSQFLYCQQRGWLHHFSLNHSVILAAVSSFPACRVGFNIATGSDLYYLRGEV